MVISRSHQLLACDHSLSLVCSTGATVVKSTVDAEAAKPQRAGRSHDIWSRGIRPVTGIIPPPNTMDSIIVITNIGRIWSCEVAAADNARPMIAATAALRA